MRSTENTIEGDHGKSFASAAFKLRQPPYLHPGSPLNQRTSTTGSTSAVRWFLEEDDGEAESAKSEMMVALSILCGLTPHCFVICDTRDRGVESMLYIVHASKHRRKMREVAFFYSFNQSIRELRFHLFGFGSMIPPFCIMFTYSYLCWFVA